ncbi:hypothetical protein [Belnapia sp. F-4-1]|uniref:hypothetical protein n=1 Tax=Belnapia sp. F-4-1 TaxID=1545443 RepID=UPI0005B98BE4|nr:hypothetical protein [Belnapia sp. F-4-1]
MPVSVDALQAAPDLAVMVATGTLFAGFLARLVLDLRELWKSRLRRVHRPLASTAVALLLAFALNVPAVLALRYLLTGGVAMLTWMHPMARETVVQSMVETAIAAGVGAGLCFTVVVGSWYQGRGCMLTSRLLRRLFRSPRHPSGIN